VFTSTYRSLWNNVGGSVLTLASLPPGGTANAATTDINIGNAALATPYSTLKLVREKGGVKVELRPSDHWTAFVSYTNERREGARPFGLVSAGGGGTGGVETAESIDYTTHDFIAGLQFADARNSLNISVSASMFRNHIDTLTIENPMFLNAANGINLFPRAVFDLYPDNNFFNAKLEYARAMPNFWNGNFTLLASGSSSKQNDRLIPSTPYAGAVVNAVAGGSWDTTASLYRQTANVKIDSRLVDAALSLHPAALLDVRAKVRSYQTNNNLDYLACNPLTGQWGRLINDGTANAIVNTPAYLAAGVRCNIAATAALNVVPNQGNFDIRSIPYAYRQRNYVLDGDLHLGRASSLGLGLEREEFVRDYRERRDTNENKLKLGYVNRDFGFGTLRVSAELDRKRGSAYNPDPYTQFYSAGLGPFPTAAGTNTNVWIRTNDLHRKYDVAERDEKVYNLRFNFMLGSSVDVSLSGQHKDISYPDSVYGRNDHQRLSSAGLDVNWQPLENFNVYGSYNYQSGSMRQWNLQSTGTCVIGTTYYFLSNGVSQTTPISAAQTAAGLSQVGSSLVSGTNYLSLCGTVAPLNPLFPTSRTWTARHDDRNRSINIGGNYDFRKARLYVNYTESRSTSNIGYTFNGDALGLTPAQVAGAGSGFPDMTDRRTTVDANVVVPLNKNVSMRLFYLYETDRIRDWHYDGVAANPTPNVNQMTFLDSGPVDYHTNVVGVFFTVRL
jgi:predicted porin